MFSHTVTLYLTSSLRFYLNIFLAFHLKILQEKSNIFKLTFYQAYVLAFYLMFFFSDANSDSHFATKIIYIYVRYSILAFNVTVYLQFDLT